MQSIFAAGADPGIEQKRDSKTPTSEQLAPLPDSGTNMNMLMGYPEFESRNFKSHGSQDLLNYFILTPLIRGGTAIRNIRQQGLTEGGKQWLKEDAKYVFGYVGIAYALNRYANAFVDLDMPQFERRSAETMKPNPEKVLYLNLIQDKDPLAGFPELSFEQHYRNHPYAKFVSARSFDDLIGKLKDLPQDGQYDRIEIYGHGSAGKIHISNSEKIGINDLVKLKEAGLNLAKSGADVRFLSCSLASGTFTKPVGEEFLTEFGRSFLPKGGQVFAATRNLIARKFPSQLVLLHGMGLRNFQVIFNDVLPNLNRDFAHARNTYVRVNVPDQSNSSCASDFSALITRVR